VDGFGSNLEFSGFVPSLQNGNDENFHSLPNMSYYIFQALLHLPSNGMRCGLQHHQPQRFAKWDYRGADRARARHLGHDAAWLRWPWPRVPSVTAQGVVRL